MTTDDNDSEWEYEYDDNATEDVYFTLDLTTLVGDAVPLREYSRNGKPKITHPPTTTRPREDGSANGGPGYLDDEILSTPQNLQILDLHTLNPIVKHNDRIYTCAWHTDLGTQIHISEPELTPDPLRPGNFVDVVAVTQARLLARPAELRQRSDWLRANLQKPTLLVDEHDNDLDNRPTPSDLSALRPGEQLIFPREAIKNDDMAAQASFLERLSAIKLKKGEKDIIPVGAVKQYVRPANVDEIREHALAQDRARELYKETKTSRAKRQMSSSAKKASNKRRATESAGVGLPVRPTAEYLAASGEIPPSARPKYQPTAPSALSSLAVQPPMSATDGAGVASFNQPGGSTQHVDMPIGPPVPWHRLHVTPSTEAGLDDQPGEDVAQEKSPHG